MSAEEDCAFTKAVSLKGGAAKSCGETPASLDKGDSRKHKYLMGNRKWCGYYQVFGNNVPAPFVQQILPIYYVLISISS